MLRKKLLKSKDTIYVGLSGGVDSSVVAKRLCDEGYTVVGVFIKTWQPDFSICNWEAERLDAMRIAARLDIQFYTCDAIEAYRDEVAKYMIREYTQGRTPNPDVMCNKYVKFGTFLDFARSKGAQKIATGHYARIEERDGSFHLLRGVDTQKDQSYFLWTLTQEQLAYTLFPIGDTEKQDVRKEAKKAGLHTSEKSDSQGICFLGDIDIVEFLSHYVHAEPGAVLNEMGERIGTHKGALFYTLGQRHGFLIEIIDTKSTPRYVIARDIVQNTITVSETSHTIHSGKNILLTECNFIQKIAGSCEAQYRYRQKPFGVHLHNIHGTTAQLEICDDIEMPSIGQSCVLYSGKECLGGGIIDRIL